VKKEDDWTGNGVSSKGRELLRCTTKIVRTNGDLFWTGPGSQDAGGIHRPLSTGVVERKNTNYLTRKRVTIYPLLLGKREESSALKHPVSPGGDIESRQR